jgi:hypothetical protein
MTFSPYLTQIMQNNNATEIELNEENVTPAELVQLGKFIENSETIRKVTFIKIPEVKGSKRLDVISIIMTAVSYNSKIDFVNFSKDNDTKLVLTEEELSKILEIITTKTNIFGLRFFAQDFADNSADKLNTLLASDKLNAISMTGMFEFPEEYMDGIILGNNLKSFIFTPNKDFSKDLVDLVVQNQELTQWAITDYGNLGVDIIHQLSNNKKLFSLYINELMQNHLVFIALIYLAYNNLITSPNENLGVGRITTKLVDINTAAAKILTTKLIDSYESRYKFTAKDMAELKLASAAVNFMLVKECENKPYNPQMVLDKAINQVSEYFLRRLIVCKETNGPYFGILPKEIVIHIGSFMDISMDITKSDTYKEKRKILDDRIYIGEIFVLWRCLITRPDFGNRAEYAKFLFKHDLGVDRTLAGTVKKDNVKEFKTLVELGLNVEEKLLVINKALVGTKCPKITEYVKDYMANLEPGKTVSVPNVGQQQQQQKQ